MKFLALLLLAAAPVVAQSPQVRLGDDAEPLAYALDLTLDPARDDFSGRVAITIKLPQPTSHVRLNAHSLTIGRVSWTVGGSAVPGAYTVVDEHNMDFTAEQELPAGEVELTIDYTGAFDTQTTSGPFKLNERGDDYLFTQFEPFSARFCFPGFDEPRFKTPYDVTIRTTSDVQAFANAPVAEVVAEDGMQVYRFQRSEPLPTYLVAYAVGPFDVVDAGTAGENDTPIRILAPRDKGYQAEYAAQVTGEVLEWLEGYFGIPYPYEKLDSVVLPLTFGFGAMENAGLITYAQTILLADPATDSIARQQRYFGIAAHELAHQWFGNLVTPVWWDDIWLNEAFASWMTSKAVAALRPEWERGTQRVATRLGVMQQDALVSARTIRQPVESYGAINTSFDGITYRKGQSVIHMFETWLGEGDFQQGVRSYLEQYSWKNANVNAFLDSLSTASEKNVTRAFGTFLDQNGIPLIRMGLRCEQGASVLDLTQSRALPVGSQGQRDRAWMTPVCVRYEVDGVSRRECLLFDSPKTSWKLDAAVFPAWVAPNAGGDGYYYVDYADGLLEPLLADGGAVLTPEERLSVSGDVRAGFEMGSLSADAALSLAEALADDPSRAIVSRVIGLTWKVYQLLEPEDRPRFAEWIRETFGQRASALGWTPSEGEDSETRLLRTTLVPFVAIVGEDDALQAEARELASAWLADHASVPGDVVGDVLQAAAHRGDRALFDQMREAFAHEEDRRDRQRILTAMGKFSDPKIAADALAVVSDTAVDLRESIATLQALSANPEVAGLAVAYVEESFSDLVSRMPDRGVRSMAATLPRISGGGCSEEEARRTETFFREPIARYNGGKRALAETVEAIRLCAALKQRQQQAVKDYLGL